MSMSKTVRAAIESTGLKIRHLDGYTRNGTRRFNAKVSLGSTVAASAMRNLTKRLEKEFFTLGRFEVKGKTASITAVA